MFHIRYIAKNLCSVGVRLFNYIGRTAQRGNVKRNFFIYTGLQVFYKKRITLLHNQVNTIIATYIIFLFVVIQIIKHLFKLTFVAVIERRKTAHNARNTTPDTIIASLETRNIGAIIIGNSMSKSSVTLVANFIYYLCFEKKSIFGN